MNRNIRKDLDQRQLRRAQALISRMVHDLGKQITRAARNLPKTEIPPVLVEMMIRDLFSLKGEHRVSLLFHELAAPLQKIICDQRLEKCGNLAEQIDQLEDSIRLGDPCSLRQAADKAIEIETLLRSIAQEITKACDER